MAEGMDQHVKIMVEVVNTAAIKALGKEIDDEKKKLVELSEAFKSGTIGEDEFNQKTRDTTNYIILLKQNVAQLATEIKSLEPAAEKGMAGMAREGRGAIRDINRLTLALMSLDQGFEGLLRSAPYVASMMGASGPVVIGIALASAGARLLSDNWETLKAGLRDTGPFEVVAGAIALINEGMAKAKEEASGGKKAWIDRKVYDDLNDLVLWWGKATDAAKLHTAAVKETEEAVKQLGHIKGTETTERGAIFKQAIERAGGDEAVAREMADRAMGGRTFKNKEDQEQARKEAVEQAARMLARGEAGEKIPMQGFPQKLREAQIDVETEKAAKRTEEQQKSVEESINAMRKEIIARDKLSDVLNLASRENEAIMLEKQRTERIQDLQDKKEAIQDKLHADLEAMRGQKPGQILQGAKAALDMYQTGAGGDKEERAHKLREQANKLLRSIDDTIKKERRLIIEH